MSTRLQKKLPIGRPLDKGNPSHGNEINTRRPDSTCVWTSLSFFHCTCVQTSLFYPLRICFRSRVFRRLFFSTAHSHRRLIFSAEHAFSVSLFFSVAHPFRRLLFSAAHAHRRISFHFRCASVQSSPCYEKQRKTAGDAPSGDDAWQPPSKPCLKFQISDQNMWSSLSFNSDNWLKKEEHTWFHSLVTGSKKPSPFIEPKRLKSSQKFRTNMFIIVGHHTEFGFNGFKRKAGLCLDSFLCSEKRV